MNNNGSKKHPIRFQKPEQLQSYLEKAGNNEFSFRAIPISGEPETFHYSSSENIVRETDGRSFDSLDDFICYAFQCDATGYARTEYVEFEVLN